MKPIALYGSELWVPYKQCYKGKSVDELFKMALKCNSEFEKVHIRFCKYVLGVNSKACNFAVHSKLGQFPLLITTLTNCLNIWLHIIQSGSDTLLSKAYMEWLNGSTDINRWVQFVKKIF